MTHKQVGSGRAYQRITSIAPREDIAEWAVIVLTKGATWILAGSVWIVASLQSLGGSSVPELSIGALVIWSLCFFGYSIFLDLLGRRAPAFYDQPRTQAARIGVNILAVTILVWLSGGPHSPFWYGYLLPLSAAAVYGRRFTYPWIVWLCVGESYLLAQLVWPETVLSGPVLVERFSVIAVHFIVNMGVLLLMVGTSYHLLRTAERNNEFLYNHAERLRIASSDLDLLANMDAVLHAAIQRAVDMTGASTGSIHLLDRSRTRLHTAIHYPPRPPQKADPGFKLGEGIAGQVALTGQAVLLGQAHLDIALRPPMPPDSIRSLCSVPLIGRGRTWGVLSVDSPHPDRFGKHHLLLLQAYGHAVADQVERVRLQEVLQALRESGVNDLDYLLELLLEKLHNLIPLVSASVFLLDGDRMRVRCTRNHRYPDEARVVHFEVSGDPLFLEMRDSRRPVMLADAQSDARFKRRGHADYVHGWLGAPLIAHGEVIGMLTIDSDAPGAFTETDAQISILIANYAALSIQDVSSRQARDRKLRQLQSLHRASSVIETNLDIENIANDVVGALHTLFEVEAASILRLDSRTRRLHFVRLTLNGKPQPFDGMTIRMGKGIAGWVAQHQKAAVVNHVRADPRWDDRFDMMAGFQTRSILAAPLIARNRLLGVIEIINKVPGEFDNEDQLLLEAVAPSVALAMDNGELVKRLERERLMAQALNDSLIEVASHLDQSDCLEAIIGTVVRMFHAAGGAIYLLKSSGVEMELRECVGLPGSLRGQIVPVGESAAGRAIRSGYPVRMKDYHQSPSRLSILDPYRLTGVMAAPLMWGKEAIGAIAVHDEAPGREFKENESELLKMFADFAAIVVVHSQKEQFLESVVSSSVHAIVAVDASGRVIEFNPRAQDLLGYSRDEALRLGPRGVLKFFGGDLARARAISDRLRRGEQIRDERIDLDTRTGGRIPVMFSAVALGEGSVGFFRDLREIVRRDAQIGLMKGLIGSLKAAIHFPHPYGSLQALVDATRDALKAKSVILYLYDSDRCDFRTPPIQCGVENIQALSGPVTPDSLIAAVLKMNGPLIIVDTRQAPATRNSRFAQQEWVAALIACPLRINNEGIGVLFCNFAAPGAVDEEFRPVVEAFGEMAAVVVANLVKTGRMHREKLILEAVSEQERGEVVGPQRLPSLARIVQAVADALGVARGDLCTRDSETSDWKPAALAGAPLLPVHGGEILPCACFVAVESREVVIVSDTRDDPRYRALECPCRQHRSLAALPLNVRGEVLGMIWFGDPDEYRITEYDRPYLNLLAETLANSLHAALLESQLDRLNILSTLTPHRDRFLSAMPPEEIVLAAAQKLGEAVGQIVRIGLLRDEHVEYYAWAPSHLVPHLKANPNRRTLNDFQRTLLSRRDSYHFRRQSPGGSDFVLEGSESCSIWPLYTPDRVFGVLEAHCEQGISLTAQDQALLEGAAAQLSMFFEFRSAFLAQSALGKLQMADEIGAFLVHRITNFTHSTNSAIRKFLDKLPTDDESLREPARALDEQLNYLSGLADELSSVVKKTSPTQGIDVNACLAHAVELAVVPAHIQLEYAPAVGLPLVSASAQLLTEVIVSLVNNSVRAMQNRPGRISLACRCTSDRARIEIEVMDTGPGIPAVQLRHLFTPFHFQKEAVGPGLGLGLWLCKLIVETWHGEIRIRNNKEQTGAAVVVRLPVMTLVPLESSAVFPIRRGTAPVHQYDGGPMLIVDDLESFRSEISASLAARGCPTLSAYSYQSALDIIERVGHLSAAILDVRLDSETTAAGGADLARFLAKHRPDTTLLLISGSDCGRDVDELLESGAVRAFIRKPALPEGWSQFLNEIGRALGLPS